LEGLPDDVAQLLLAELRLEQRALRIEIQEQRYLSQNRAIAERRLEELVAAALKPPPPPRHPTRRTVAAEEQRLHEKDMRGEIKQGRRRPEIEE